MALNTIVNNFCKELRGTISLNAPIILTTVGCIGLVGTVVLTAKQAPKAKVILQSIDEDAEEPADSKAKIIEASKYYIPVIAVGAATAACFISGIAISKQREANMASAFAALASYHNNYRNTLIELKGKEVDDEVISNMDLARGRCDYHILNTTKPDKKMIFVDSISGQEITCYERDIMDAEYHFNRNFVLGGYSRLNDWYTMAGFDHTTEGDTIGWSMSSGLCWVDFEHIPNEDGTKVEIHYTWGPCEDDLEDWF